MVVVSHQGIYVPGLQNTIKFHQESSIDHKASPLTTTMSLIVMRVGEDENDGKAELCACSVRVCHSQLSAHKRLSCHLYGEDDKVHLKPRGL